MNSIGCQLFWHDSVFSVYIIQIDINTSFFSGDCPHNLVKPCYLFYFVFECLACFHRWINRQDALQINPCFGDCLFNGVNHCGIFLCKNTLALNVQTIYAFHHKNFLWIDCLDLFGTVCHPNCRVSL